MAKIIKQIYSTDPVYFIKDVEGSKDKTKFQFLETFDIFESDLFGSKVCLFNQSKIQIILDLNILSRLDLHKYLVSKLKLEKILVDVTYQALEHSKFDNNYDAYVKSHTHLTQNLRNLKINHLACLNVDDFNNIIELYNEIELLDKNKFLFKVCNLLNSNEDVNTTLTNIINLARGASLKNIHLCLVIIIWMAMLYKHGDPTYLDPSKMSNLNKSPTNFEKKLNGFHDILFIYYLNIKVTYMKYATSNIFYFMTHDAALAKTISLLELTNSIAEIDNEYIIYNEMNNPAYLTHTNFFNVLLGVLSTNVKTI